MRKVCAYGLATAISILTFRVFGRAAGGLESIGDPELWALLLLCGLAVLWDTQEHADAASAVIRPKLDQHLSGNVSAPPDARLFPVLAS